MIKFSSQLTCPHFSRNPETCIGDSKPQKLKDHCRLQARTQRWRVDVHMLTSGLMKTSMLQIVGAENS